MEGLQFFRFFEFTIFIDLFTWKNSQLACLRWSSLHAAHDQKEKPFSAENVMQCLNTTTNLLPLEVLQELYDLSRIVYTCATSVA